MIMIIDPFVLIKIIVVCGTRRWSMKGYPACLSIVRTWDVQIGRLSHFRLFKWLQIHPRQLLRNSHSPSFLHSAPFQSNPPPPTRVGIPLKNRSRFERFERFSSKIWAVWAVWAVFLDGLACGLVCDLIIDYFCNFVDSIFVVYV